MEQNKAIVTFIVICYNEYWEAPMFIGAMKCQKDPRFKIIFWHDGPNAKLKEFIESLTAGDDRFEYRENEQNLGSWGCWNRIAALQEIDTEYVVQCTIQEYYLPNAVQEITKQQGHDIIVWDTIHHSFDYMVLNAELKIKRIDWSNFAIKTEIAKTVGIKQPEHYCADGIFIQDCVKSGLLQNNIKLKRMVSIKN